MIHETLFAVGYTFLAIGHLPEVWPDAFDWLAFRLRNLWRWVTRPCKWKMWPTIKLEVRVSWRKEARRPHLNRPSGGGKSRKHQPRRKD